MNALMTPDNPLSHAVAAEYHMLVLLRTFYPHGLTGQQPRIHPSVSQPVESMLVGDASTWFVKKKHAVQLFQTKGCAVLRLCYRQRPNNVHALLMALCTS